MHKLSILAALLLSNLICSASYAGRDATLNCDLYENDLDVGPTVNRFQFDLVNGHGRYVANSNYLANVEYKLYANQFTPNSDVLTLTANVKMADSKFVGETEFRLGDSHYLKVEGWADRKITNLLCRVTFR